VQWSKTENVAWVATMPGPSAATPVVYGDRVYLPSTDRETRTVQALALDRKAGKVVWQHKVADGYRKDEMSNYASPSATTDGERVYFFYGNGELVGYGVDGVEKWRRNLQKDYGDFAYQWTPATSPTLYGGRLYVQVLQRNEPVHGRGRTDGAIDSFLLAADPATGKTLFQAVRPCAAVAESHEAYSTPIPRVDGGRTEILVVGGDCLTGHDAATGRELWRWGTWNPNKIGHWRLVPSPVSGGGVVLACGPKGSPVYAIKAGGEGTLPDSAVAWQSGETRQVTSDVPTPLYYLGDFFVLSDVRKSLTRVEAGTGRVKWTLDTPGNAKYEASPTGADGKIYLMNFRGEVVVVDAEKGTVVAQVAMGDEGDDRTRSTVVVAHGQLYVRTLSKLYCIGGGGK
jgi:outer membrane protein assembly factor BamB